MTAQAVEQPSENFTPLWTAKRCPAPWRDRAKKADEPSGWWGERQPRREGSALAWAAVDDQPPAVAVEDVLHQREAQTGAALRPAFRYIDAIEAFGQARQ